MIYPSASDILRTIDATIVDKIEPSLKDLSGRSAMATVRHLLRHVRVRIEVEGQVLTDDIAALRPLLADVRDFFATVAADDLAAAVDQALTTSRRDPALYPSLAVLGSEAQVLREGLYQAQKALLAMRDQQRDNAAYLAIRESVRTYLVTQIEQEGKLIGPAFFGMGPRR